MYKPPSVTVFVPIPKLSPDRSKFCVASRPVPDAFKSNSDLPIDKNIAELEVTAKLGSKLTSIISDIVTVTSSAETASSALNDASNGIDVAFKVTKNTSDIATLQPASTPIVGETAPAVPFVVLALLVPSVNLPSIAAPTADPLTPMYGPENSAAPAILIVSPRKK